MFSTPFTISLMSTFGGVAVGLLALRVGRVRGWSEQRWFAVIAFCASAYALANLSATLDLPASVVIAASHLQLSLGLLQGWAWARYARDFARSPPSDAGRWAERVLLAGAGLALVPGLAFQGQVSHHHFQAWGVMYNDAPISAAGYALMLACLPAVALVFGRFRRAYRGGARHAGLQAAAFGSVLVFMGSDALTGSGRFATPYLMDIGFLFPVALMVWASALRFIEASEDLEALRERLESLVDARSQALAEVQEELVRAERLAQLGQLANGVAHQVSNPAAVVTANLRWLAESLASEREAREVSEDALVAMQRINALVRRLADAGRIAAAPRSTVGVELRAVVDRAAADVRPRLPSHVTLEADVPEGLGVRARPEVLEQVLHSLLSNAAEALPGGRPGRIAIRAERRSGGVRLTVEDDGVGMAPDVLERAFEPFFTTKPAGQGNGLSLPIARGIVEVHGGALWLESTLARGTRAVLELPETAG